MTRDLSVVIVTHQSAADLPACLDSLLAHRDGAELQIVVSDSGSTDGTATVAAGYPVTLLPGENLGFGAANNRALAHGDVCDSRYVLFLNPDTEVLDGSLAELLDACDRRPEDGLFTVRQVDEHGELIKSLFHFPSPARYWLETMRWLRRRDLGTRVVNDERYAHEGPFDWAVGSFLLVRRETLRAVGGFDERFFLTSEEVDLCRRACDAGWGATYLPSLTIMHRYGFRPHDAWRAWILVDHQARYAQKWFSSRGYLSARAAMAVRHGLDWLDLRRPRDSRLDSRFKLRAAVGLSAPSRKPGSDGLSS